MATHDEIIAELKLRKDDCELAGCMENLVTKDQCEKNHVELKTCMMGMKNTMQTKSHYLWELAKVVVIPLLTTALIGWGLFSSLRTEVSILSSTVNKLDNSVMELIKDRR